LVHQGQPKKLVIIGVGNLLLKDQGVGVHVAQELMKRNLPQGVKVFDGGVAGMGLLDLLPEAKKVVLIDAVHMNLEPGAVVRFTPEEVRFQSEKIKLSAHDLGVMEVLELAKALNQCPPEVIVIGIQPQEISWGTDLTPAVQNSLPKVVEAVLREMDPWV